jgi:CO dehydrogenase/acetyl-CoA synthase beta subunit
LGTPGTESYFHILWQKQTGLIGNDLYIAGVDLQNLKKSKEFLLYVMIEINSYDLFKDKAVSAKNISRKLNGIMVKGLRDKIWFRISKKLSEKGFDLYSLGQAVSRNFFEHMPDIAHMDVIIAADHPDIIGFFRSIHHTIGIIEGNNRKLKWVEDGVISCDDLNCNTCDEKPGCDIIKDIVVKKKREAL